MDMTNINKKKLAVELAPYLVDELRKNSEMIIQSENKASKVAVRLVDSGKISGTTRDELDQAEAAIESASSFAEMKTAAHQAVAVFRTILLGR